MKTTDTDETGGNVAEARHSRKAINDNLAQAVTNHRAGQLAQAADGYRKVLALDPHHRDAAHDLSIILNAGGENAEALEHCDRVLAGPALNSKSAAPLHNIRGMALVALGRLTEGLDAYQSAIQMDQSLAEVFSNQANAKRLNGDARAAKVSARQALDLNPKLAAAQNCLGNAALDLNQVREAEAAYTLACDLNPENPVFRHNFAILHHFTRTDEALSRLRKHWAMTKDDEGKSWVSFALAKALDDVGDYQGAAECLLKGNGLMATRGVFNFDAHGMMLNAFRQIFPLQSANAVEKTEGKQTGQTIPVFIIGVSRSGKTLLESLLATHPKISGLGERVNWGQCLRDSLGNEQKKMSLRSLTPEEEKHVSDRFLGEIDRKAPGSDVALLTSPGNLPFIGMALDAIPQARVVHCQRNIRDLALSIYFKRYTSGNEFAYRLDHITQFIHQFDEMMAHWSNRHQGKVLTVAYDDVIQRPQVALESIANHCGFDQIIPVDFDLTSKEINRWKPYAPFMPQLSEIT